MWIIDVCFVGAEEFAFAKANGWEGDQINLTGEVEMEANNDPRFGEKSCALDTMWEWCKCVFVRNGKQVQFDCNSKWMICLHMNLIYNIYMLVILSTNY